MDCLDISFVFLLQTEMKYNQQYAEPEQKRHDIHEANREKNEVEKPWMNKIRFDAFDESLAEWPVGDQQHQS